MKNEAEENPKNLAEPDLLFRAVIHATRARLYEEAFFLYFEKIKNKQHTMFIEGSQHADQVCVRSFFDSDWELLTDTLSEEAQLYLLSSSAVNLIMLGLIDDAIGPTYKSVSWHLKRERWTDAATMVGHLASMLIVAGRLNEVEALLDSSKEAIVKCQNPVITSGELYFRGYSQFLRGDTEKARIYFLEAEDLLIKRVPLAQINFPTLSAYYNAYLLHMGQPELALQRAIGNYQRRNSGDWISTGDTTSLLASDTMMLGLAYLSCGNLELAAEHLNRQVEMLRSSDEWLYLPSGLNARAQYSIAVGDLEKALKDLEEAEDISKRTGAKFGEWDTYLNMAQLHFRNGDHALSNICLEKAAGVPNMQLYTFRDTEISYLRKELDICL